MLTRRENTINLTGELGDIVTEFPLAARLDESPAVVGTRLRAALDVTLDEQFGWPNEWRAWATWRAAIERLGVLVFQFGKVALSEVRGIALLRTPMPVVGINSKEIPEARCFTALHEVVHLMLAAGHQEEAAIREHRSGEAWGDVEHFAEIAASHALVPEVALNDEIATLHPDDWDIQTTRRLARRFRVTPLAMATRLRESGYMNWARYQAWKRDWDDYVATLPERGKGFATPVAKALGRNGRPFAQLVLEALSANRITPVVAARYLDLRFEHFDKLRAALREGSAAMMGDD
jgi:Zn-dependent peptidase ImmA (M78 family)